MIYEINETHDPNLKSWVESANDPNTDFPIQNLPFCQYRLSASPDRGYEHGVVIGDKVVDLYRLFAIGTFSRELHIELGEDITCSATVDGIADNDKNLIAILRRNLVRVLSEDADALTRDRVSGCLVPIGDVTFEMPFWIGDYTDFYCSIYHATNVGSMFRPDNPLLPNYKYVPIGYHGRASSIVISGTDIKRPHGQNRSDAEAPPKFIPSKSLDYEMELGFFVGQGNELGTSIPISEVEQHIFGVCLVNDWSARDIQAWEYQPLGPFLAKNFATTISPYVVTMEALAPFRTKAFERDADDPQPLDYLNGEQNQKLGGLDINLEVYIQTEKMRAENIEPHMLSRSNTKDLYWTIGQMLTHHASNGCNLQTGDLMATGTVSGPEKSERGCLLELTWRGTEPIDLPSGEQRRFLEDGDEIIMKGFCEREGFRRIGLGECCGKILPAWGS
ncbi:MAG: fumarylacetoacetase [Blastocatellia bacterium]|nr:fumarylacetoacetase [Blastocatellia bacterium]